MKVTDEVPEPGAGMLAGLKLAVTPTGRPVAEREIAASNLPEIALVMVELPDAPAATVSDAGFAVSAKLDETFVTVRLMVTV